MAIWCNGTLDLTEHDRHYSYEGVRGLVQAPMTVMYLGGTWGATARARCSHWTAASPSFIRVRSAALLSLQQSIVRRLTKFNNI